MIADSVRVTNVCIAEKGGEIDYFTLQGVYIGSLVSGRRVKKEIVQEPKETQGPKAAIVKSPSPKEVREAEAKHNDELAIRENRVDEE